MLVRLHSSFATDHFLHALIELRNVSKAFGRLVVLDRVNLAIAEGETLVVIGASGSGKSVMLKHIVGLLQPDSGESLV